MTGFWSIIIPEAAVNLCTNPSFETVATDWAAGSGHTLARSSVVSFKGAYSGQVTIGGTGTILATYAISGLTTSGVYFLSAWVNVPAGWDGGNIRLEIANFTGGTATYNAVWTSGVSPYATWVYIETKVTLTADVAGDFNLGRSGTANTSKRVYIDAVQFEANAVGATTYCDGDQPGCLWNGAPNLSISNRSAQVRSGGRVYNFDEIGAYVIEISGQGMPPVRHNTQEQALLPGALFLNTKVLPRTFVLVMEAVGSSRPDLHLVRKKLINFIKPDAAKDNQPFVLRYSGASASKVIEIQARYMAGAGLGKLDGWSEKVAITMISYDPFCYEIGEEGFQLSGFQSLTSAAYGIFKKDGIWNKFGTGFNAIPTCIAVAPDGKVYVGGQFATANGVTVNCICYWNGTTFVPLTVGGVVGLNGFVQDILIAANGDVYICGNFTDRFGLAGTPYNHIVRWDGSAWNALGTGMNDYGMKMAWGNDGKLYVGGNFTTAGGVTVNRIASWDGTTWAAMGATPGANGTVYGVVVTPSGDVVIGGSFATAGGVATCLRVARWTGSAWVTMGGGLPNGVVGALLSLPNGEIYAAGTFTDVTGKGNYLSIWNGAFWRKLPSEVNDVVNYLEIAPDGMIWISGSFTAAGVTPDKPEGTLQTADRVVLWNGTSWSLTDFDLPGTPADFAIAFNQVVDMYLAFGTSGTAVTSAAIVVNNVGNATAYPRISIKRTGGTVARVKWVKNETTGVALFFNEYSLRDGEMLTIDCTPGARTVISSLKGNVFYALLPSSDLTRFDLLPGNNLISVYILTSGAPTLTVFMTCKIIHWSVDGVAA